MTVPYSHLRTHLPRARISIRRSRLGREFHVADHLAGYRPDLDPDILRFRSRSLPIDRDSRPCIESLYSASTFLFLNFDILVRHGFCHLFEHSRSLLSHCPSHHQHVTGPTSSAMARATVSDIFWHFVSLCCLLDRDRALGCSPELGSAVARFALELLPHVQAHCRPERDYVQCMFVGLARVFAGHGQPSQLDILRRFWNSMAFESRVTAVRTIVERLRLRCDPPGSNTRRMWRALRRLARRRLIDVPVVISPMARDGRDAGANRGSEADSESDSVTLREDVGTP